MHFATILLVAMRKLTRTKSIPGYPKFKILNHSNRFKAIQSIQLKKVVKQPDSVTITTAYILISCTKKQLEQNSVMASC